jgi:2-desacetyl-2-hydroxyethyl bacteriochlorophyllide A dehydrogenase
MKAVIMERGVLTKIEQADPVPKRGEVLVKSISCGICGSDLHAARHTEDFVNTSREAGGAFKLTTFNPVILGHEFCAEIVDYGPKTERSIAPGQLVCAAPVLLRETMEPVGYSDKIPGGFAQYMLLSESLIVPVPNGCSADLAALTEPMAVGLHAVNKAQLSGKEPILIIGAGPVGLAIITALKQIDTGPIIVSDFAPGRRKLAEAIGADIVIDPSEADPYQEPTLKRREGLVIFECVGIPGMIDAIFLGAPKNAKIMVVGVCLQQDYIRPLIAINKELSLHFLLGWSMEEFTQSLRYIAEGKFDVSPLITGRTSLDDIASTFEALATPNNQAKVLVKPWI